MTKSRDLAPEQPRAQRVERGHPHARDVGAEQRLDARAHLFRRFVREGDGEHLVRLCVAVADEVRNPAGDDASFSRPGAGKDEKRSVDVQDRFALFGVERVEEIHVGLGARCDRNIVARHWSARVS
jgi:hypothetical protein